MRSRGSLIIQVGPTLADCSSTGIPSNSPVRTPTKARSRTRLGNCLVDAIVIMGGAFGGLRLTSAH